MNYPNVLLSCHLYVSTVAYCLCLFRSEYYYSASLLCFYFLILPHDSVGFFLLSSTSGSLSLSLPSVVSKRIVKHITANAYIFVLYCFWYGYCNGIHFIYIILQHSNKDSSTPTWLILSSCDKQASAYGDLRRLLPLTDGKQCLLRLSGASSLCVTV